MAPFSKTGGLADVAGALPEALAQAGLDVTVVSPCYPSVQAAAREARTLANVSVPVAGRQDRTVTVLEHRRHGVRHLFTSEPGSFERPGLYGDQNGDYPDNAERFGLFCRAAIQVLAAAGAEPDIVHCHDWQTGLVPLFLSHRRQAEPLPSRTRTVFTIHNLGYQGNSDRSKLGLLGIPQSLFTPDGIEFYGSVSFLKAGLLFATRLTTVSPTYAREIQTSELGFGMDGVLRKRAADLSGILNGIDTEVWNPAADQHLTARFTPDSLAGKEVCRTSLVRELGLAGSAGPVFGVVSRLAEQKGIDMLIESIPESVSRGARFAVLGTGSADYETRLTALAQRFPQTVSVTLGFSEPLAHRIYAGTDFFLMPSKYEPCGLGQMIALRYATLPIAASTGGLRDTVVDQDENPSQGNGFLFERGNQSALQTKMTQAMELYEKPDRLNALRVRAMRSDFSWKGRAIEYVRLYRELVAGAEAPS